MPEFDRRENSLAQLGEGELAIHDIPPHQVRLGFFASGKKSSRTILSPRGEEAQTAPSLPTLTFLSSLRCTWALAKGNLATMAATPWKTAIFSTIMALNNFLFFMLWIVFFAAMDRLGNWTLEDVAVLYGIANFTVGSALFCCNGVRSLAYMIYHGEIDSFLVRPRHPLPAVLFSRGGFSAIGDMLSAPLFWYGFGGMQLADLPVLLAVSLLAAMIFLAALVIFQSLAFWWRGAESTAEQFFNALVTMVATPQHGQTGLMKAVLVSVIPAWFMGFVPVSIVRDFTWIELLLLTIITVGYVCLALVVFNAGVKKYRKVG